MSADTLTILCWIALVIFMVAEVGDYYLTTIGLAKGFKEVGLINRLFIKSEADAQKLPLIAFIEGAAILFGFGLWYVYAGAEYGLAWAATVAVAEIINDIHSLVVLGKI